MAYDRSRIDEAVLALLATHLFDTNSAWKGYDFEIMNRLHDAGFLFDPVGKQKTVQLTDEGIECGLQLAKRLFGDVSTDGPAEDCGT